MDDQKSVQQKSLAILGGVLVLTVAVGFLPAKWFGIQPATQKYAKIDLSSINSIQDIVHDSNGDGKTDWNEVITQTYDGSTADIQAAKQTSIDPSAVAQLNNPNNLTGSLSKSLYLSSAYADKAGGADPQAAQTIATNLMSQEAAKITFKTYASGDLDIDTKETASSVKTYGNGLGKLITLALHARLVSDDAAYLKDFLDTKNKASYDALVNKRDVAKTIVSQMLAQKVPLSASAYHLLTLNRVSAYADTLDNILKVETDPVRSSIAFGGYVNVASEMLRSVPLLTDYFKTKAVVFSPNDAGYVFDPRYTVPKQ